MPRCSRVHVSCFKSIVSRQVWDEDLFEGLGMEESWKEAGQMPVRVDVLVSLLSCYMSCRSMRGSSGVVKKRPSHGRGGKVGVSKTLQAGFAGT